MKIIVMGSGRRGAALAAMLDKDGHEVTVLDTNPDAFDFLPEDFGGTRMVGNGMDTEDLKRAGAELCEAFVAATRGDNRNVLAAQIAKRVFNIPRVVTLVHDPIREEMYHALGLRTVSPTRVVAGLLKSALERGEEPEAAAQ